MGLLDAGLPSEVAVGGEAVAVTGCGHREGILVESLDLGDPEDRMAMLVLHYAPVGSDDPVGDLPAAVLGDVDGALRAALAWHEGASSAVSYGLPRRRAGRPRRLLDWDQDAGIVASDFQRLYGIDLLDPSVSLHWYRFVALLRAAARVEGSLVGQAMAARGDMPAGLKGDMLEREVERRNAWALRETRGEMEERLRREFRM